VSKFDAEQRRVAREVLRSARRNKATPMERLAANETILVEANARHIKGGDRDSSGAFQQRPSQGWGPASESVGRDADQFFAAARKLRGKYTNAGALAQAVQRSAFPERYAQRRSDAIALAREAGGSTAAQAPIRRERGASERILTMPPADDKAFGQQIALGFLQRRQGGGSLIDVVQNAQAAAAQALGLAPETSTKTSTPAPARSPAPKAGRKGTPGVIRELFYDPLGGWDEGTKIPAIGGHSDHVHVTARSHGAAVSLAKTAQRFGLTVRELEPFDKVDPVHTKGSFHYSGKALDASGSPEKMRRFTNYVRRKYRLPK